MLRRVATCPVTGADIVLGKILGRVAIASVQVTALVSVYLLGSRVFGEGLGGPPVAVWAILILFGAVVSPLGIAIGGFFRDADRAANVGVLATMAMAALGGCWWPVEVVSPTLRKVALLLHRLGDARTARGDLVRPGPRRRRTPDRDPDAVRRRLHRDRGQAAARGLIACHAARSDQSPRGGRSSGGPWRGVPQLAMSHHLRRRLRLASRNSHEQVSDAHSRTRST